VIAWTLGAAVSIGVGLLALSLIGVGLTADSGEHLTQPVGRSDQPLTTPSSTAPVPSAAPSSAGPAETAPPATMARTISSHGGTVVARCVNGAAYLDSWSASPGYRPDNVSRGPSTEARVTFEGSGGEVKIRVTCIGSTVHSSIEEDDHRGPG
jgi:hypothetical protein